MIPTEINNHEVKLVKIHEDFYVGKHINGSFYIIPCTDPEIYINVSKKTILLIKSYFEKSEIGQSITINTNSNIKKFTIKIINKDSFSITFWRFIFYWRSIARISAFNKGVDNLIDL